MQIEVLEFAGIEPAIRAMRLPHKSGEKSDSDDVSNPNSDKCYRIGPKDHELSMKLIKAGSDHRKHIRLIDAWFEIQAPLYWWKQLDTYRFGVDKVSESTMHTIMNQELSVDDFECPIFETMLSALNIAIQENDFQFVAANLPEGYLQTRIVKCSYEALRNMYQSRKNHKLKEWRMFCKFLEYLPYSEFICEGFKNE